jgi:hypothetical protein
LLALSSVCIVVNPISLIERGGFWDCEAYTSRTTVAVDGIQRTEMKPGSSCQDEPLVEKVDTEGTPIAGAGGIAFWCFAAPLAAGVHRVDVSFEKGSGEMETFSWTFTLQ